MIQQMAVDSAALKFYDIELFKSSILNPLLFTVPLQKIKKLVLLVKGNKVVDPIFTRGHIRSVDNLIIY